MNTTNKNMFSGLIEEKKQTSLQTNTEKMKRVICSWIFRWKSDVI